MTIYAFTPSAKTYQPQPLSNLNAQKLETTVEVSPFDTPESSSSKSGSFVQSVLQSLQTLGLDTLDASANGETLSPEANEALQTFLQNLYKALTPANVRPSSAEPVENIGDESLTNDLLVSGGTNLKYTADFSEAELGDYLTDVKANLKTALENIGQYIKSNIVFDVKVFTKEVDSSMLAEANSSIITETKNGEDSIDTSFVSDSMYGVELSAGSPDSKLYLNLSKLGEMSFSGKPTPDKFDLTSVLTHEILHGIAFTGVLGRDYPFKTVYDELVVMDGDQPYFVGRHAKTTNGGNPIPLAPAELGEGSSFYHVANPSDLMAASIKKGEVKTISDLNIAMLQDMGISITGKSPTEQKIQNAYLKSPSDGLNNLISSIQQQGELQVTFDNLVQTLGGSLSSETKLQDFLTQLATTTQNGNPLENSVGTLLSVAV